MKIANLLLGVLVSYNINKTGQVGVKKCPFIISMELFSMSNKWVTKTSTYFMGYIIWLKTKRHPHMMTSLNGNIFRVTGPLCGEFTDPGEFPTQRPVTWSFDVFFDLRLNTRLSKQPWGWWFETPSWSLWRQCNAYHLDRLSSFIIPQHCEPLLISKPKQTGFWHHSS